MGKKDDSEESIDGASIAAQILNRMPSANKERIVRAIQTSAPEIAIKIEANLFNFEEIADLTPQGAQLLMKEVKHEDLLLSLKRASANVKKILFEGVSERRLQIIQEDFERLPPTRLSEVEDAQRRILEKLDELRKAGLIRTQSKNDLWV